MRMLLLGDVCPTADTDPLFREKQIDTLFGDTVSLFENNDVNLINLECALTERGTEIEKFGPCLRACPETAEVLREIGVNYVGIANNHVYDWGNDGIADTVANLTANGIEYTGFGENYEDARKNLLIEKNGERIIVIAVCEHEYSYALDDQQGSRPFDEIDTLDDIRAAKAVSDRVIVTYHGGKEHCRYPSPRLIKVCRAMVRAGADLVTCQHSHCIGCYEQYQGGHIMYGQGNFHFAKTDYEGDMWNTGMALHYDTKENKVEFTPYVTLEGKRLELAKGEEKARLLRELDERNAELADGSWINGWRAFCEEKREMYYKPIRNAANDDSTYRQNHFFAHYLDCEAHTDVWRELFQTAHRRVKKP